MRLLVSDHSFVRIADWHPDLKQFVPMVQGALDAGEAQKVVNGLHVFLASLERGRPATFPGRIAQEKKEKYPAHEQSYIFDRALSDLYTMVWDATGLVLVTVTWIQGHATHILDDARPRLHFEDIDRIEVPYLLSPELEGPEWNTIRTPSGRDLELCFGATKARENGSFWIQNKQG